MDWQMGLRGAFIAVLLTAAYPALAQKNDYFDRTEMVYFEINLGTHQPDEGSDLFNFFEETSTFDSEDLDGFVVDFKLYYQLNNRLSIGGGLSVYEESVSAESRDFVDIDGFGIVNETEFQTTWVGAQMIWTPFGAGEQFGSKGWAPKFFVPYLTAGIGFKAYEVVQVGEFVDETDPNDPFIFADRFEADGESLSTRFGCGFRLNLHRNVDLNFSLQQEWAEDDVAGSYSGFGDLDLGSKSAMIGVTFRI
ncbi:outer membrane beta-barrel protein [Acanthopleuribacter pedis]|uniref:Outer membrane beta-barrel protein n=1 Tax=Acanthopleuribacter pedis TaxID=442870 RepID=A0A8J7Q6S8_9BACT|nr:outer membrane beta-barrel protein [Acanthopleuribacter pedis]MBO1317809.1 outer membrane beta-barrel protein [Acanthopleuribacter pedis]